MESFMLNACDEFENVHKRNLIDNNVQIKIARISMTECTISEFESEMGVPT